MRLLGVREYRVMTPEHSGGSGLSSVALKAMVLNAQTLSCKAAFTSTLCLLVLISAQDSCSVVVKGMAFGARLPGLSSGSAA